ncbi:predicted protein [Naegleria gruberi]|uniref:Predicted protein n=1 Tax=Naegleria gruberi TaxID=5762 RepID=D2V8A7_NAEGR|nr:uncharacterized protein NAEGRDRAFT_65087 [Naegleria gruberi]EFC47011.1 predicted protein [Naegleria gruberi]|eukprot:XP_002679755.1 predicted protein [Naegleria gruberi strain NEG-M]
MYKHQLYLIKKSTTTLHHNKTLGTLSNQVRNVSNFTTPQLVKHLKRHHQHRGSIVFNYDQIVSGEPKYKLSHSSMEPLLEYILSKNGADGHVNHQALFLEISPVSQSLFGCFIHNTNRGLAQGNVDLWHYPNASEFVSDGLKQSEYAARKMALTNQFWGGGKGIIQTNPDLDYSNYEVRRTVMNEFGSFVSSLRGVFYAQEGFGIQPNDMAHIFEKTRFTTSIPKKFGGNGNISPSFSSKIVINTMESALSHVNLGNLSGKIVAIQGFNKETEGIISSLLREKHSLKVILTETDPLKIKTVKGLFAEEVNDQRLDVRLVFEDQDSILNLDVDILYPSSGTIFNSSNIPLVNAKIICGVSQSQFEDASNERQLRENGVILIPSLLTKTSNFSAVNEIYGIIPNNDPEITKMFSKDYEYSIYNTVKKVIELSEQNKISTQNAAFELADKKINEPHPFIPLRGSQIIHSLVSDEWHLQLQ